MRFGHVSTLALDLEPVVPTWDRRSPSEQGPWAHLTIWFRGENLCRNWMRDSSEVRDGIYVPLAPIADWLVRNTRYIAYEESARVFPTDVDLPAALEQWKASAPAATICEDTWDDLRWEWSERHFLQAGAEGSWLPNLAAVRVDDDLWLSTAPCRFATPDAPNFLYRPKTDRVPWRQAKETLTEFVESIRRELVRSDLTAAYSWALQENPLAEALDIGIVEYAQAGLGLATKEVEEFFGLASLEEIYERLDLAPGTSPDSSATFQALRDLELESSIRETLVEGDRSTRTSNGGLFLAARRNAIESLEDNTPELQGYAAARNLRQDLGLNGQPLENLQDIASQLAIAVEIHEAVKTRHDRAAALDHRDGCGKVLVFNSPQTQRPWSQRMETLRGTGHLLLDGATDRPALGAGSSYRTIGPRRKRSGAFAAEMLLPQEAIRQRTGGELDAVTEPRIFEALMEDFGVGATTAAWQCFNAGFLSSRERVDELISEYGRTARTYP